MKNKLKFSYKSFLIKIIRVVFLSYFAILIFLYFNQKNMIYYPNHPKEKNFFDCPYYKQNEKKIYKNTRFYERKWEKNNIIVFFHWNAWWMCDRKYIKELLEKTWNSIIMVEYYWYSDGPGIKPNISNILKDVKNIWEYLENKNYNKIYVMWRSIWTWPASYFSKNFKTDKLVLISPYSQLYKVARNKYPYIPVKLIFSENYNNEKYLENYENKLLIIHWEKDNIIPLKLWEELFNKINNKNKRFLKIKNWNHNDLFYKTEVNKEISEFLE